MSASRDDVVREALRWEGTPYHSHARLLGLGVDCCNLPAAVYESCGLIPHVAPRYSKQWYLHHDRELFLEYVRPHAAEVERDAAGPGDMAIWRFGRTFSHAAILIEPPVVLHAVALAGAVIRSDMSRDEDLRTRPCLFFTLWPEA